MWWKIFGLDYSQQQQQNAAITQRLNLLQQQGENIMATLQDILADVQAEKTMIDGIGTLISGLKQQVADALKNSGISAADQATIDAIFAQAEANKAALTSAVGANVNQTAPTPAPAPAQ